MGCSVEDKQFYHLEPMLGANEDVPRQRGTSVVKKPGWPIGPVGRSVFGSEPAQL